MVSAFSKYVRASFKVPQFRRRRSKICVRIGILWIEARRCAKFFNRRREIILHDQRGAEVVVRVKIIQP